MVAPTRSLIAAPLRQQDAVYPRALTLVRTPLLILLILLIAGLLPTRVPMPALLTPLPPAASFREGSLFPLHHRLHGPAVAFDAASGLLLAVGDAQANRVRLAMTAAGYLEVTLDDRHMSSDPDSPAFTADLARLTPATITRIWLDGGGGADTLILDSQHYPASLQIGTDARLLITGSLAAADELTISAHTLRVEGALSARRIGLFSAEVLDIPAGASLTARDGANGGQIDLAGRAIVSGGTIRADGINGGQVRLEAASVLHYGTIAANRATGAAGQVQVRFSRNYVDTAAALTAATGGRLTLDGGRTGHLFSSGRHDVSGEAPGTMGGEVLLLGKEIVLVGAHIDASGDAGGGSVLIGGGGTASSATLPTATTTYLTPATMVTVAARRIGGGGRLVVWADEDASVAGTLVARGGVAGGDGGHIEVSARDRLAYAGTADASAQAGRDGTLLLDPKNITISSITGMLPQYNLINPTPSVNDTFGATIVPLSGGGIVVTDQGDDTIANNAGAVYLFNGHTGVLSSTLTGSTANDQIGNFGVVALTNGNYVVRSPNWDNGVEAEAGAATWGNGTTGTSGTLSATNSLVGTTTGDQISSFGIMALSNGNYVVRSLNWDNGVTQNVGAATWGNGTTGITGAVSPANSLVGSSPDDQVGFGGVALTNGNYVVGSPNWDNGLTQNVGAATWGNGTTGIVGAVSPANSLVGATASDQVSVDVDGGVVALTNGNYVVRSPSWDNGGTTDVGAVTWGNGTIGITGTVALANSLVGATLSDQVGVNGVTALTNGNYVVRSSNWDNGLTQNVGAATWGNGTTGIVGAVSLTNSLVGATANDNVSSNGVTALTNGNYVVGSENWDNGLTQNVGAATWGNGTTGITGTISLANSLIGATANDNVSSNGVTALTNGNYVVRSSFWNNGGTADVGAATWGNGTTGIVGLISAINSLVGVIADDRVSGSGVTALTNGNYVVGSENWHKGLTQNVGAATWGNGATGATGTVSTTNSLVGSTAGDNVGFSTVALSNGNYVVRSSSWDNGLTADVGAATWGNGTTGITGTVSLANSLVGTTANDSIGNASAIVLPNGNYVVLSSAWDNGGTQNAGAATWVGADGKTLDGSNTITPQNSMIGQVMNANPSTVKSDSVNQTFLVNFISENGGRITAGFVNANLLIFARAQSQSISVTPAFLKRTLDTGTAVVLQASNDISIDSALTVDNTSGSGGALTLQAGRSILINADITTDNGALTLIANDQLASGVVDAQRDAGAATITMATGTSINAGGGAVTIELRDGAGKTNATSGGISLAAITAGSLAITHTGPTAGSGISSNAGLVVSGATTLTAGAGHDITLTHAGNDFNSVAITAANNVALQDSSALTLNTLDVAGTLTVTAATALTGAEALTARNSVQLTAGTTLVWNAALAVEAQTVTLSTASVADLGSSTTLDGGTLNAANGVRLSSGDSLSGVGTLNGPVTIQSGGQLSPGSGGGGTLTLNGNLTAESGAIFVMDLNSIGSGQTDQVAVNGTVNLSNSLLATTLGLTPAVGTAFVIIANDGSDAVVGTFNGLAEGATFTLGDQSLEISYKGGDGNDVVLQVLAQQDYVYLPLIMR